MKVNIQVQRRAETLDEGHRAGAGRIAGKTGSVDQVGGDTAGDDPQRLAHQVRITGEQEAQLKRDAQHPMAERGFGHHLIHQ